LFGFRLSENAVPLDGLSSAEVSVRVARGDVNRVERSDWLEYRAIIARNVLTLFNALVVPAAIALFLLKEYSGAWSVSAMALINSILGLVQEIRAKHHLDKLAILTETRARVVRDGQIVTVPSGDVVKDDHILLATGEPVVADGTMVQSHFLEVDEALLTGESDPVPRRQGDRVLSGSFAVAGEGVYRADQVGRKAFAQQTTVEARAYRYTASPIQRSLDTLIKFLTAVVVLFCALYVVFFFFQRGSETTEQRVEHERRLAKSVAATVTSMVPQGLVPMATLAMLLGAVRMAARGAVVQRISAVESMAAVNVLCMDKTGTLTTNRLRLEKLHLLDDTPEEVARERLRLFAWASVDSGSKSIQALRTALGAALADVELLDQLPFKSQNRYSAVRVRNQDSEHILVLGAREALEPYLVNGGRSRSALLSRSDGSGVPSYDVPHSPDEELLRTAQRLLLFAEAGAPWPASFNGSLVGCSLRPLALIALSDELRPEARAVLEDLAGQGIAFKIISGDHPQTVRATVGHLALYLAREPVVSGDDLAKASEAAVLIRNRSVFGRIAPRQKMQIVSTLQAQGSHVAMIGDGVNDVLPIKKADLGIAMGEGSSAAKTVSGLVLENNNFELLPATLAEGRLIVHNLRRSAKLFLTKNVYSLMLITGSLFGLAFPYVPQQVTLLNFLTIGVPAFLITLSKQRTLPPTRPGFLRDVARFVLPTGVAIGIAGLLMVGLGGRWYDEQTARTLLLSALVLSGIGTLARVLWDDLRLRWLAAAVLPIYLMAMYVPVFGRFFELTPLAVEQWGLAAGVAAMAVGPCLVWDWLEVQRGRPFNGNPTSN
jgi:cation-transporting ATPase E